MAFNGTGTFVRIYSWATDKANGIKIRADRMDAETDGIATGLSTCVTRDGQSPATANLPMGTFKHTGVAVASARTDYLRASQTQDNDLTYFTSAGTINAYTLTPSPAITARAAGQQWLIKIHAACAAAPTLAVSGLAAGTIVNADGSALIENDLVTDGQYTVRDDGTNYRLVNRTSATVLGMADGGFKNTAFTIANDTRYIVYPSTAGMAVYCPSTTQGKLAMLVKIGPYDMNLYGTINGSSGTVTVTDPQSLIIGYSTAQGWA